MSALAWPRCPGHSAARPEPSATTGSSPSPARFDPSATRHALAGGRRLAGRLRRVATVALLLGLAAPVAAQTIDSTWIIEGETKTFTVTGIPSSWTGNIEVHTGGTGAITTDCFLTTTPGSGGLPNWDVCENASAASYNQNTRTYTFELQARADSVNDPDETFTVTLRDSDDNLRSATFTITVREPPTAKLSPIGGSSTLPEGAGTTFNVLLSRELGPAETVKLPLTIGGTATRGTDYRIVCIDASPAGSATCNDIDGDSPSITFDGAHVPSNDRTTGPLRLETIEDNTAEANETVTLQLGGGMTTEMTITEAPSSVEVSFTKSSFSVSENAGQFQPVFRLDNRTGRDLEIPLIFTPGTATPGTDYTPIASATIPADGRSTSSFDIPIIDDNYHEGDETFRVAIDRAGLPAGVTAGTITRATVTITEDDLPPQILLSQDNFKLAEPAHASCSDDKVGTETTSHVNQNTGKLERVERHYGRVLTTRTYKVKLDSSPGPGKYVSVEIWDPTDLDRPDVRDGLRDDGSIAHKGRFSENARIHGISWEGGRQGRITVANTNSMPNTFLTFTDKNWNQAKTVTVNIHCAQHDVNNPLPIWHFAFRHNTPDPVYAADLPLGHSTNRKGDNSPDNTSLRIAHVRVADRTTPTADTSNRDGKLVLDAGSGFTTGGRKMIDLEFAWNHPENSLLNDYDDAAEQFAAFRVKLRTVEPAGHPVQEKIVRVSAISPHDGKKTTTSWYAALEAKGHVGWVHGKPDPADSKYEWSVVPLDRRWNEVDAERVTKCVVLTSKAGPNGGRASRIDETATPTCTPAPPPTAADGGICDRTPAVRNAIVGKIGGVSHCRDVTPDHLAFFVTGRMSLQRQNLSSLKAVDFKGLTSLEDLRLYDNQLTSLPPGIFDDLAGLMVLDLDDNQITTLQAGIFDHNPKLNTLYMQRNQLQELPENIFRRNRSLHVFWLAGNPGVPFRPTAPDAGPDQTVATGAEVTLSGAAGAGGPWGDNVRFKWRQVDGPASHTPVQGGVQKNRPTATFTAPAAPTTLHFRLAAEPVVFHIGPHRGIDRDYDWVTITVGGGGQSSPQQTEAARAEEPACVSPSLLADVDDRIANAGSPAGTERWTSVRAALTGQANAITLAEIRAIHERRTQHGWSTAQWDPVIEAMECLAMQPEEEPQPAEEVTATPTTPILSLSAGSDITEGSSASFTVTADPAPSSDITVTYNVAQSGDYLAAPGTGARTATLVAGTTSIALSVATVDDAADEADGSVSVTLSTATGYSIATGKGSFAVTIADNDEPVISITAGPGVTEGSPASFTVTANPVPAAPLDVALTITQSGDVAASGQTGSRTVTIPTTGTLSVTVATDDDGTEEAAGSITATLGTGTGYTVATAPANAASVAVSDNDTPSTGPTISIADASMQENQRNGWFTLTLSEPVAWPVTVHYATRDSNPVSAVAGEDYLAWKRSWQLGALFRPGQTETTIHVRLYNDSHDEDPETFEMVLFDAGVNGPPGVTVSIADGVAIGTITNSDPMPAAFLSRFGRTVAQQALDGIETRLAADRSPGTAATIAGQALALGTAEGLPGLDLPAVSAMETDPFDKTGPEPLSMTAREALLSSSFTTTGETASGSVAIWGRAARDSFDGQEGSFSLDGTATTAMLGADYGRDRWLLGLALLQSSADGSYADTEIMPRPEGQICPPGEAGQTPCGEAIREGDGKVEASLTAIVPYASLEVSERLRLWGALGHGSGEVTLKPETGGTLTADTSWQMAAAGLRAELAAIGSGALALTSDALWSRTRSEKTHALAASDATVTRLRAGLEASWQIGLASGAILTPGLEAGARHDGGDAERGAGIELGGSLAWQDPASGFAMDLSARKLIAHDDDEFAEHGLAASFIFDPRPDSARGLSVSLRQDTGEATGGVDALFMPQALERTDTGATATTAEAAYGLPALAGRFTIAPHARLRMDDHARDYTLGWRLTPERGAPDLSLGLEATRREHGSAAPVHGVGVGLTLRW